MCIRDRSTLGYPRERRRQSRPVLFMIVSFRWQTPGKAMEPLPQTWGVQNHNIHPSPTFTVNRVSIFCLLFPILTAFCTHILRGCTHISLRKTLRNSKQHSETLSALVSYTFVYSNFSFSVFSILIKITSSTLYTVYNVIGWIKMFSVIKHKSKHIR